MRTGLLSQLDAYYSQVDEAQNPIRPDEVLERSFGDVVVRPVQPGRELPIPGPASWRRRWLVALGAATAVLVLVGGAALLLGVTGSDTPLATAPEPTSLSSLTWSRVPHDEAVFANGTMSSVTAGGPGLVAVGGVGPHDGGLAAVWTSVDGITWSRVPHDDEVFGSFYEMYGQGMSSVTAGGPGLVAVGHDLRNPWDALAAVWTSPDGVTWSRVPHDDEVFGGYRYQAMWGVTAGGPGLVAVGGDDSRLGDDEDVAVWTSVDGITWSRVPHDEAVLGAGEVTSVTSAASGLVAVGGDGDAAAVWTSLDGVTWSRVPHNEEVFGGAGMQSVTVGGPGFVAVGEADSGAAVWTSPSGITWSRVPHDEDVFGGAGMQSVTSSGLGLVAVGFQQSAAAWTSPDGITWSRVPYDEEVFGEAAVMEGVTIGGPGVVAVGTDGDDAAVWVAVPED